MKRASKSREEKKPKTLIEKMQMALTHMKDAQSCYNEENAI